MKGKFGPSHSVSLAPIAARRDSPPAREKEGGRAMRGESNKGGREEREGSRKREVEEGGVRPEGRGAEEKGA